MKALTIPQPWASLIVENVKHIITLSYATNYRGPLAIHAGLEKNPAAKVMSRVWAYPYDILPRGVILATCELVGCEPITDIPCVFVGEGLKVEVHPAGIEYLVGDYTLGRYAWILADVMPLDKPIPARGRQGLWEWKETSD